MAGLLAVFIAPVKASAQNRINVDSLLMVKNYLLQIQHTVESKQLKASVQINRLDSLIHKGSWQQEVLTRNLPAVLHNNSQEQNNLLQDYRFIVQSAILYKTDLRNNNNKPNGSTTEEMRYMKQHIPPLVSKIAHYCSHVHTAR